MTLLVIYGDVGSGKTLLATLIAINDERPIFSNYKIDSERWTSLEPQMLNEMNDPSLVIVDEAYVWLESRLSGKDINRYLSYILFQSRKRQIDFIITAQLLSTIDLRFKGMADTYVLAERSKLGFIYHFIVPGRRGRRTFFLSYINAQKYFLKYDTMEKVNPIDDELVYRVTPNKAELLPELDRIVEELLEEAPAKSWTKGMIADYCLENGKPFIFHDMLYNRIKRKGMLDGNTEA